MSKRIKRIALTHFRGATKPVEIPIDDTKPLVLIFGENGTGKSTIIDAVDVICNRVPGSIRFRSSTNAQAHLPAIGHSLAEMRVEISCGAETITGRLIGRDYQVAGGTPPVVHILRRSQLLRLVEATPADRYAELRRFIDVAGVEKSEQALLEAMKSAKTRLAERINAKHDAEATLNKLWQGEVTAATGSDNPLTWARGKVSADPTKTQADLTHLQQMVSRLDAAINARNDLMTARGDVEVKRKQLEDVQLKIDKAQKKRDDSDLNLLRLLNQVQAFIAPPYDGETCPVCQQPITAEALRQLVADRFKGMKELRELNDQLNAATKAYDAARTHVERQADRFAKSVQSLAEIARVSHATAIAGLRLDWTEFAAFQPTTLLSPVGDVDQSERLLAKLEPVRDRLISERDAKQADVNQYNAIKVNYQAVVEGDERIAEADKQFQALRRAHEIVHQKRIEFTQQSLDDVSAECNRLYSFIHPGEPLGLQRFRMDERTKGSVHQDAHFEGTAGVPAQAYFSDSHLDTIGFCLFLAIAKRSAKNGAIVVLDDVFTSVDAQHLTRIIDLVGEESESFDQFIVTTHSRQWRERFRQQQIPSSKFSLIDLRSWTRGTGIQSDKGKLAVEELSSKLAAEPFDRQATAQNAGILLEATLEHLTLLYGCSLRRKHSAEYTLGELLDGVGKLSKHLVIRREAMTARASGGAEEIQGRPLLEVLHKMAFIRNQVGAHFNVSGLDIADNDVKEFARLVVAIVEMLVCRHCGMFARRRKGTHFECSCAKTQMTPLEMQ